MKKAIALISALMMAVCSFTACGKDEDNSSKVSDKELIGTWEKMVESIVEGENSDFLECIFPKNMVGGMERVEFSYFWLDDIFEEVEDSEIKSVAKKEDVSEKEIENMEKYYSLYDEFVEFIDDNDVTFTEAMMGNIEDELNDEIQEKFGELGDFSDLDDLDIDVTVDIQDAKDVTFIFEKDGEEYEEEIRMYKVKGEDWKVEFLYYSMKDYVKGSEISSANSAASSISNGFNASLVDMDVKGVSTGGLYIFSSDSKKVIFEDESSDSLGGHAEDVYEGAHNYFGNLNSYDYFAVCINGSCVYVAVEKNGVVGTYPDGEILSGSGYEYEEFDPDGADLDEVYDKCMEALG
ncbi:MAG: hypothetical protein J6L05_03640 [Ruminococcus sp.]|nr:hypothetical protein [Ruminococcus sp.]